MQQIDSQKNGGSTRSGNNILKRVAVLFSAVVVLTLVISLPLLYFLFRDQRRVIAQCQQTGGKWEQFEVDSAIGTCLPGPPPKEGELRYTHIIGDCFGPNCPPVRYEYRCGCGSDRCWDGEKCIEGLFLPE